MVEDKDYRMSEIKDSQRRIENVNSRRRSSVFNLEDQNGSTDPALSRSSFIMSSHVNLLNANKNKPKYENTFKLQPDIKPSAHLNDFKKLAESALANNLSGQVYEENQVRNLTRSLAEEIKNRIKCSEFFPDRYRIVVMVVILELNNLSDIRLVSRRLALNQTDTYSRISESISGFSQGYIFSNVAQNVTKSL